MATIPESHVDLLRPTGLGALATIGPDGFPQVTALGCFLDDDGVVKMSVSSARQKTKNLKARPECTLLVIDPANSQRTLEIRARAAVLVDENHANLSKMLKASGSEIDPRSLDGPGETRCVIVLDPIKVNTYG